MPIPLPNILNDSTEIKSDEPSSNRSLIPQVPTPTPVLAPKQNTIISLDQTTYIMDKNLLPIHRTDPNVIKFIKSYLQCRSVRQASTEAGITKQSGENLKKRPDIWNCIQEITDKAVLKHGYDAGEIVERVKEIVDIDPGELEKSDGTFVESLKDVSPETRRAIKKFKAKNIYGVDPNGMPVVVGKLIEVEFWDKIKAAEMLGQEKEIFKKTTKVEHEIGKGMRDTLLEARKRALDFGGDTEKKEIIEMRDVGEDSDKLNTEENL